MTGQDLETMIDTLKIDKLRLKRQIESKDTELVQLKDTIKRF